jgi:hypothetical protein
VLERFGNVVVQWNKGAPYSVHLEGCDTPPDYYRTREAAIAAARRLAPVTARKCDDFDQWGIYYVSLGGRNYTVNSIGGPFEQILLHDKRKAPAGSIYPSGAPRETIDYVRAIDSKGPIGQEIIRAAMRIR